MDNDDEETFDRPEGYTCTQPHQVCDACAGNPAFKCAPLSTTSRGRSTCFRPYPGGPLTLQFERWLSRLKKPQISHTDVGEAVQHLDRTDDGL